MQARNCGKIGFHVMARMGAISKCKVTRIYCLSESWKWQNYQGGRLNSSSMALFFFFHFHELWEKEYNLFKVSQLRLDSPEGEDV